MRPLKNMCEVAVIGGGLADFRPRVTPRVWGAWSRCSKAAACSAGKSRRRTKSTACPFPENSPARTRDPSARGARKVGVQIVEASVAKIELNKRLTLTDQDNKTYHPEAIIVASGASLRKLGVPGEEEFTGRGVSHCATCDGGFFRGQDVVVVGGGDSAAQEALVLAKTSRRVIMVCHSPLKAKRDYIEKMAARENVRFVWDSEVSAILGKDGVAGVRLRNVKDGTSSDIECTGLFPYIGVGAEHCTSCPPIVADADGAHQTNAGFATLDARVFAVGRRSRRLWRQYRRGHGGRRGRRGSCGASLEYRRVNAHLARTFI